MLRQSTEAYLSSNPLLGSFVPAPVTCPMNKKVAMGHGLQIFTPLKL